MKIVRTNHSYVWRLCLLCKNCTTCFLSSLRFLADAEGAISAIEALTVILEGPDSFIAFAEKSKKKPINAHNHVSREVLEIWIYSRSLVKLGALAQNAQTASSACCTTLVLYSLMHAK
jgi:hypothetical protein